MLVRQYSNRSGTTESNNVVCFCQDRDRPIGSPTPGVTRSCDLRLGCSCLVHFDCFIAYCRHKISNRLGMDLRGVACPYGTACQFWSIDTERHLAELTDTLQASIVMSDILLRPAPLHPLPPVPGPSSIEPDQSILLQRQVSVGNKVYFITVADLEAMRLYGQAHAAELAALECKLFTQEELEDFAAWMEESAREAEMGCGMVEPVTDPYVLATSKACPHCGYRSTHWHGHHCHHISRNEGAGKYKGCPHCHTEYCYRCLSPDVDNERLRGAKDKCLCGSWRTFCSDLESPEDIAEFLRVDPVPRDVRCGCTLCPECVPGIPCSECTGCAVCKGGLNPGPLDLETPWARPEAYVFEFFKCCQNSDSEGIRSICTAAIEAGTFNPNASVGVLTLLGCVCFAGAECLEAFLQSAQLIDGANALDVNMCGSNGLNGLLIVIMGLLAIKTDTELVELESGDEMQNTLKTLDMLLTLPHVDVNVSAKALNEIAPLTFCIGLGLDEAAQSLLLHPSMDPNRENPMKWSDEDDSEFEIKMGTNQLMACVNAVATNKLKADCKAVELLCQHPALLPEQLCSRGSPLLAAFLAKNKKDMLPLLSLVCARLVPDMPSDWLANRMTKVANCPAVLQKYLAYERYVLSRDSSRLSSRDQATTLMCLLTTAGELVNAPDADGVRPLEAALRAFRTERSEEEEVIDCEYLEAILALPGIDVNSLKIETPRVSPLMMACKDGVSQRPLRALLKCPTLHSLEFCNPRNGKTALMYCMQGRHCNIIATIKALLETGRDCGINIRDQLGRSAIMHAVARNPDAKLGEALDLLLAQPSVDVNLRNEDGQSAIFYAVMVTSSAGKKASETLHRLFAAGADVNLLDNYGRNVLSYALDQRGLGADVVKTLLSHEGLDASALVRVDQSGEGCHCLHKAIVVMESTEVVRAMLEYSLETGRDVGINVLSESQKSPLMYACQAGLPDIVDLLLAQAGIAVNASGPGGLRALNVALNHPSIETRDRMMASLLGVPDIDVFFAAANGQETLLMTACRQNDAKLVRLLLQTDKVDINFVVDDANALVAAISNQSFECALLLLEQPGIRIDGTKKSALKFAIKMASADGAEAVIIALLRTTGVGAELHSAFEMTCASSIAADKKDSILLAILAHAEFDAVTMGGRGRTALHLVCMADALGQGEIRGKLIAALVAASPLLKNTRDSGGATPLMRLLGNGSQSCIEMLANLPGLDWSVVDGQGSTYLHYASARHGDMTREIADLVIKKGLDVNAENSLGLSPLVVALEGKNRGAVQALLSSPAIAPSRTTRVRATVATAETKSANVGLVSSSAHGNVESAVNSVKIMTIGDSSVGKTALLNQFANKNFSIVEIPTIGIDFKHVMLTIDGQAVKLQVWDTAGLERFRNITVGYYRKAQGILLVYDVTNRGSFESIDHWMDSIRQHAGDSIIKVLVGNKAEFDATRAVQTSEGQAAARKHGLMFFEVSAKSGRNVKECFEFCARQCYKAATGQPLDEVVYDDDVCNDERELKAALLADFPELAGYLLVLSARRNLPDSPLLFLALQYKANEIASRLLADHAPFCDLQWTQEATGEGFLHLALKYLPSVVPSLLASGLDVNLRDKSGITPLAAAFAYQPARKQAATRALLINAPSFNMGDDADVYLEIAAKSAEVETLQLLLSRGSSVRASNSARLLSLPALAASSTWSSVKEDSNSTIQTVMVILDAPGFSLADAEEAEAKKSLVWLAVHKTAPAFLQMLLDRGLCDASVASQDDFFVAALRNPVLRGSNEALQRLITMLLDLSPQLDPLKDVNCFQYALEAGHVGVVEALLARGGIDVNANVGGDEGTNAVTLAIASCADMNVQAPAQLLQLIISDSGFIMQPRFFFEACELGTPDCVLLLLPLADVNAEDEDGLTALDHATGRLKGLRSLLSDSPGDEEVARARGVMELLLRDEAISLTDGQADGLLWVAIHHDAPSLINILVFRHQADFNEPRTDCKTRLILAAWQGRLECARVLLALPGINVNAADDKGRSALHCAAARGHYKIVSLLCAHPYTDVNQLHSGCSALMLAVKKVNIRCVIELLGQPQIDKDLVSNSGLTALGYARRRQNEGGIHTILIRLLEGGVLTQVEEQHMEELWEEGDEDEDEDEDEEEDD